MTFTNDRLVARARSFPFGPFLFCSSINRILDINTKSDQRCGTERIFACESKKTVCKHKQKQMQPSSNKHELMV